MIDIYVERGMSQEDATSVIRTMSKYKEFFVDVMMAEELALQIPEENHVTESMKEGVVMFFSFASFGSLPLLGYVIIPAMFPELGPDILFASSCVVTGLVLFLLGSVKSFFSASGWLVSGLETLFLGGCCTTLAYTIGQFVEGLIAEDVQ